MDKEEINQLEKETNDFIFGLKLPVWFDEFIQECYKQNIIKPFDCMKWKDEQEEA